MQTQKHYARTQKKTSVPFTERLAFSPAEFASRFNKHPVWAYRLVYAGKLKVIEGLGNLMIPHTEVDRLLSAATIFEGKRKPRGEQKVACVSK